VLGYFGEDIDTATALIDRALALSPSFARGWNLSGWLRLHAGKTDVAIEHSETCLRLSPRDPLRGRSLAVIGIAQFFNRSFDDAAAKLLVVLEETPSWTMPYRVLAACYAHMGRLDDAREIVKRLRAVTSAVVPSITPFRNPEHRELLMSGLRLAMGETV
jgi:tetratricopeptide (TPR) repeat protein